MQFDSVIFDLDGTLWDFTETCAEAWNIAIELQGVSFRSITSKDIRSIMGLTHDYIFQKIFPDIPVNPREELAQECYKQEVLLIRQKGGSLYPYIESGLKKLKKEYPLFIVSNCQQEYLNSFMKWSNLEDIFQDSECAGNTGKEKADNIELLSARNGLENAVYIGDTTGDQEAALQANVAFIHANYGFGTILDKCQRVNSFEDLVNLLC